MRSDWELAQVTDAIIGHKVIRAAIAAEDLVLTTDRGTVWFQLHGACCASMFTSVVGVRALLAGGPVTKVRMVDGAASDTVRWESYGFELTVEHPVLGEQRALISLLNDCAGGWIEAHVPEDPEAELVRIDAIELTEDITDIPERFYPDLVDPS